MTGGRLADRLAAAGLHEIETPRKRRLGDLVLEHFSQRTGAAPATALWVPGRIEVFGKHTDYAGGHSLVAPVPRGFIVVAGPRTDGIVRIVDAARGQELALSLGAPAQSSAEDPASQAGWRRYAATTVRRLSRNFPGVLRGADITLASDLPPASGMSSSSALMVGVAATLVRLSDVDAQPGWQNSIRRPADAAGYYACVENGMSFGSLEGDAGVGTHGGSEDHVALICGRAGHVSAWRFVPIAHVADAALPADWMFVIASSGVAARKTGEAREAYNRLSFLVRVLLETWNRTETPARSLREALASDPAAPDRLVALIQERTSGPPVLELENRLTHFLDEDARIPAAVAAVRGADRAAIGALSAESQSDAVRLLQNQVAETEALAEIARTLGAFGASSFGAGFGGSVWALVKTSDAPDFTARWLSEYRALFPSRTSATGFLAPPGPALSWL